MALQRPLTSAARCLGCQQLILRSFIASVGGLRIQSAPRRALSRTSRRFNDQSREEQDELPLNDINEVFESPSEPPSKEPADNSPLPWYLQVQQPLAQQPEHPLAARQKLPDLPDHPPPILQPLLEHTSIELGMDDLTLLDLRTLDPPPALGANLLMVVGTARSEKHLHVSADRLCRWLRSQYKLSPFADGLLGRNELKLILRRKAKRTRLLSAVGAKSTADTELDEGIRTGWVCVHVGRVEGGVLPGAEEEAPDGIVGFGPQVQGSGTTVVVQLMTEEKREEVELERLWGAVLKKSEKEREERLEQERDLSSEEAPAATVQTDSRVPQQPSLPNDGAFHPDSHLSSQSIRAYHTSARRLQATPRPS